ncbi:MAG: hypothetical protein ABWZ80_01210 [Beijerinckiaceae bacterium]
MAPAGAARSEVAPLPSTIEMPEQNSPDLQSLLEKVQLSANELDIVGRDNESIRNRCQDIVAKVANAATLGEDLAIVFGQVDALIRELEQTKSELIQRNAIFAIERDAHLELKARMKALSDESEIHKADNSVLRTEAERLNLLASTSETRIEELEQELKETKALAASGEQERNDLNFRVSFLTDELRATQQRMLDVDATLSGAQSELSSERHRIAVLEQNNMSLQSSLADSQAQTARMKTDMEDANIAWESARQQLAVREADIAKLQAEHTRMRALWQQATDAHSSDVSALQSQLDHLKSSSEVTNRLLAESRDELQLKLDEARLEERKTQDALAAASVFEQKLQAAEAMSSELAEKSAEHERAHETVLQRMKPLLKEIKEKEAEIRRLSQQLESTQLRMTGEADRFQDDRERLDETVKTLTEHLEHEKVLRALAEGALEADRRERTQLQHALQSARNGQQISSM